MPSRALTLWTTTATARLDEIEQAHRAVGGGGRGRRIATLQINHAYAMLLSSHFQGFCRDLHSEAIDHLCSRVAEPWAAPLLRERLTENRKLDAGNPNPGNLGADFGRLGMRLWPAVQAVDARNRARQEKLESLNRWRNAIAHQDFTRPELDLGGGRRDLHLADVRAWRTACGSLATALDRVVGEHIAALVGGAPW